MINTRSSMLTCDNKLTSLYYLKSMMLANTKNAFVSNENNIKTLEKVG